MTDNQFSEFVKAHSESLLGYLRQFTNDVEDIVQESWRKAWENRHRYDRTRPFGPWLFTIAKNTLRNAKRRKSAVALAGDVPVSVIDPIDDIDQVEMILRQFPEDRNILSLLYFRDMTYREAAAELGIPVGTLATKMRRMLKKMRRLGLA